MHDKKLRSSANEPVPWLGSDTGLFSLSVDGHLHGEPQFALAFSSPALPVVAN